MVKCLKCSKSAMWMCKCSNVYLCQEHAKDHSFNHSVWKTNSDFIQLEFMLSEKEKIALKTEVKRRVDIIERYKRQIILDTSQFINSIGNLFKNSIKKLDDALAEYQKLLNIEQFDKKTKEKADNIIKGCIDPFNIQNSLIVHENVINYYNADFLKEIVFFQTNAVEKLYSEYKLCVEGHTNYVNCVAISSDNKYVASGSTDRKIIVWNIEEKVQEYFLEGHTDLIFGLAFTPDMKFILSASMDNTVRIWNIHKRIQHAVLSGHTDWVRNVSITHDSRNAISASRDMTL